MFIIFWGIHWPFVLGPGGQAQLAETQLDAAKRATSQTRPVRRGWFYHLTWRSRPSVKSAWGKEYTLITPYPESLLEDQRFFWFGKRKHFPRDLKWICFRWNLSQEFFFVTACHCHFDFGVLTCTSNSMVTCYSTYSTKSWSTGSFWMFLAASGWKMKLMWQYIPKQNTFLLCLVHQICLERRYAPWFSVTRHLLATNPGVYPLYNDWMKKTLERTYIFIYVQYTVLYIYL